MVRKRRSRIELKKLLNSATRPIYFLDDEYTLTFCNRSCLEWVGMSSEEVLGCQCGYHSDPDRESSEVVAGGLCPPPEAMAGREMSALVVAFGPNGRQRRRWAKFLPLGEEQQGVYGVVALVDSQDLPDSNQGGMAHPKEEIETARLHDQIREFRHAATTRFRIDRLIGSSAAMRRARAQVVLAAESEVSVLIVGPSGSGRKHLASTIHYGVGSESAVPLVPLDCSILDAEVVESVVQAAGSWKTSSDAPQPTTLLLNDIDRIPSDVQQILASALVGEALSFRLIATANARLEPKSRVGQFHPLLAALLSTLVIELPPLTERREDLPLLAQTFVEEWNTRGSKQLAGFSPEALDQLAAYHWPENVDELAQIVAASHEQAEGAQILPADLPEQIRLAADAAAYSRRPEETIILDEYLARIERELIDRAMKVAKGNKSKAAKMLGMTRPRLYRRLMQLEETDRGDDA